MGLTWEIRATIQANKPMTVRQLVGGELVERENYTVHKTNVTQRVMTTKGDGR